ncbi:MAG TPA: amino acid adenylation domain-containing protein, partial [Polyangiaceae bacterium]|nr:amino acid adenylation domain-containing protein [Polyangiaceae bacterium]
APAALDQGPPCFEKRSFQSPYLRCSTAALAARQRAGSSARRSASGSGGAPKGVVVAHRGVVNVLAQQIEAFGLDESSRSLFVLSTSFDASVSDLGTALLAGATLVVAPEAETRDGPSLFETIERRAITYVDLPPAFLRVLEPARCPASLRCIVIGGEACPPEVVRRWAERVRVVNVYGPTEATVCSSLCPCDPVRWTKPLVGRPLAGITYLVLDEAGRAAKEGQAGELCIAGDGLAIGYLHQPELTAERFVELAGRRFYRTGDRVLVHPDGELEFVGRFDRQVKVGGVRVELDEVEAELGRVPGVAEAAVVARPEGGLVAFVARAASGASLGPASLRARLRERLPLAAVPRAWVFLEALPRGTSGKLDRAALAEGAALGPDPHAPRPGRRAELASLWARLLGAWPAEGDRFLDAGGDSLAALQLVALAESLGLALSAERLFDNPRFADLVDAPARPAPPADVGRLRLDAEAVFASLAATWGAPASGPAAGAAGAAGFGAVRASGALGTARAPGPLRAKAKAGHALVT